MNKWGFILLMCLSNTVFAQTLWHNSETGMNVAQVQELFPNATAPDNPAQFSGASKALLTIPQYRIGNGDYKVDFIFKDEKLTTVRMTRNVTSYTAEIAFNEVEKLLKIKYGNPIDSDRNILSYTSTWLHEGTTISLTNLTNDTIIILYKANEAVEASKL